MARTWSPRGKTPLITVKHSNSGRTAVMGLVAYRPGHRPRMMFRTRDQTRPELRRPTRRGFDWTDYRGLLTAAHTALDAPIVVVWDNLNSRKSGAMRHFIEAAPWLTVHHLPAYAPDLNPVEGLWSLVKRGELANLAVTGIDHLARTVRRSLRRLQHRPEVLDGLLAHTGLKLIEQTACDITL
ncbi:transposase [Nocardiopsis gilva]|uniref:transposase n=1 Tax=Nocardiopsis gilva TaxID=280236 RepID=UPI001E30DEAD|nr:transposase [Nocardiopsis gilva]